MFWRQKRQGCSGGKNAKDVQAAKTPRMFRRICNPTEGNIRIYNPIKAVQNIVNDDFSGLQILIFAAAPRMFRRICAKDVQADLRQGCSSGFAPRMFKQQKRQGCSVGFAIRLRVILGFAIRLKRCKILSMTILADYKSSYLLLPDCKSGRTYLATSGFAIRLKRCKILSMTILADCKSSYLLLSDCKSD